MWQYMHAARIAGSDVIAFLPQRSVTVMHEHDSKNEIAVMSLILQFNSHIFAGQTGDLGNMCEGKWELY